MFDPNDGYMYDGRGNDCFYYHNLRARVKLPSDYNDGKKFINIKEEKKYFFQLVSYYCPDETITGVQYYRNYLKFRGKEYNLSDPVDARKLEHEIISTGTSPTRVMTAEEYVKEITGQNK